MNYEDFEKKQCAWCNGNGVNYSYQVMCAFPCEYCLGYGYEPDYERPIKRKKTMNYSTAVMLINTNIRAIKVSYEVDHNNKAKQTYLYKTLDSTIGVNDYVVVPTTTRHKMTVCRVEEVDAEVDFEDDIEIKWVVAKTNKEEYNNILIEEQKWIEALKASEKRRKREELKKGLMDMYADDGVDKLAIANMSNTKVIDNKSE